MELSATTVTASTSGSWETGSTWVGGNIPQCGDTVIIGTGKTIQVTTVKDYTGCGGFIYVSILGTLNFQTGKKLLLPCGSQVIIATNGKITAGNGGGNSNVIDICSVTVWNAAAGTLPGPVMLPGTPLPVQLLHFMATPTDEDIELTWVTASELNNAMFIIEKSSDSKKFLELGKIEGAGTSSNSKSYKFSDKSPMDGLQYYRLTQIDYNGTKKTFDVVATKWNSKADFRVYPNPSAGPLFANVASNLNKQLGLLMITNTDGSVVVSKDISFKEKTKNISLLKTNEKLKPGSYVVNIVCNGSLYSQHVVIQ